jgi:hypothetical protein
MTFETRIGNGDEVVETKLPTFKTRSLINKPVKVQFESNAPAIHPFLLAHTITKTHLPKLPKATMTSYLITGVSRGIGVHYHRYMLPQ